MAAVRRILTKLAKGNELLCRGSRNFAGLLLVAMVVIVILQIVFRYVLNDPLIWTEEIAKTMMVWSAFLVAPWAYRNGANIRIDMFVNELSPALRKTMSLLLNSLIFWIVVVFLIESVGFWQRGQSIRAASLPIQVVWFYSVVPVAFSLLLLVGLERILRDVLALLNPDEDFQIATSDDVYEFE